MRFGVRRGTRVVDRRKETFTPNGSSLVHFAVIIKNPAVITNPKYPVRYFFKLSESMRIFQTDLSYFLKGDMGKLTQ